MSALRLLLVDDEVEFLEPLSARLVRRGIACVRAESTDRAIELLMAQPFDCAVVDIKMPGRDGLDLLRRIRLDWPAVPVVLLTGHGAAELRSDGLKLGAYDCLSKPVELDHLLDTVRRAVEGT